MMGLYTMKATKTTEYEWSIRLKYFLGRPIFKIFSYEYLFSIVLVLKYILNVSNLNNWPIKQQL